jgi:hypothetical protein
MFVSRYLLVSQPALVLLGARGLTKVPVPALAAIAIAAVAGASGAQVSTWYGTQSLENWRSATRFVVASSHPADTVVVSPRSYVTPFEYYERRAARALSASLVTELPHLQPSRNPRVWVVLKTIDTGPRQGLTTFPALEGYCVSLQRVFTRVRVELYIRTARFQRPNCPPPNRPA